MKLYLVGGALIMAACATFQARPRRPAGHLQLSPALGTCDLDAYMRLGVLEPGAARPVHQDSADTKAEIIYGPQLSYPDALRSRGVQGGVRIAGVVKADSLMYGLVVVSMDQEKFAAAAASYLNDARFRPGTKGGRAGDQFVCIPVNFKIVRSRVPPPPY